MFLIRRQKQRLLQESCSFTLASLPSSQQGADVCGFSSSVTLSLWVCSSYSNCKSFSRYIEGYFIDPISVPPHQRGPSCLGGNSTSVILHRGHRQMESRGGVHHCVVIIRLSEWEIQVGAFYKRFLTGNSPLPRPRCVERYNSSFWQWLPCVDPVQSFWLWTRYHPHLHMDKDIIDRRRWLHLLVFIYLIVFYSELFMLHTCFWQSDSEKSPSPWKLKDWLRSEASVVFYKVCVGHSGPVYSWLCS